MVHVFVPINIDAGVRLLQFKPGYTMVRSRRMCSASFLYFSENKLLVFAGTKQEATDGIKRKPVGLRCSVAFVCLWFSPQEGKFSLRIETAGEDTETVIERPANAEGRPANAEGTERITLPGNDEVKNAIEAISDRHVSVFSYAIMSGCTDAVEAISDLVLRIFCHESEKNKVRSILLECTP